MLDLKLLREDQIFGDNKLDFFIDNNTRAIATDFAILTGTNSIQSVEQDDKGKQMLVSTGDWWTLTPYDLIDVITVSTKGNLQKAHVEERNIGVRPTVSYSEIKDNSVIISNKNSNILEIQYGQYPQFITDGSTAYQLERLYRKSNLEKTGKVYSIDKSNKDDYFSFLKNEEYVSCEEYKLNGEKYIRLTSNSDLREEYLSGWIKITPNEVYWIKVEPIIWLVDEKNDIALSKYILLGGIQFRKIVGYRGNFNGTTLKKFMNDFLSSEIYMVKIFGEDKIIKKASSNDIDTIFKEAIGRMNEINDSPKVKKYK